MGEAFLDSRFRWKIGLVLIVGDLALYKARIQLDNH